MLSGKKLILWGRKWVDMINGLFAEPIKVGFIGARHAQRHADTVAYTIDMAMEMFFVTIWQ